MATRAKKKKKGVDCHASINNLLKRHLLNGLMDFEIILQECSLSDLPKLQKWSCPTTRAKNRKKKQLLKDISSQANGPISK